MRIICISTKAPNADWVRKLCQDKLGAKLGSPKVKNHFWLEPVKFLDGSPGATTWVHLDVSQFEDISDESLYCKDSAALNGDSLSNLWKNELT